MSDSHLLSKNNIIPTDYQKPLVSGTDIKTVNSNSLLGSGNISLQEPITGAASSVLSSDLTASRAVVSNANGKLDVSSTTSTELGYVHGVTSDIQTQLNAKQATISDLSDIRSGASAGATAVQPASLATVATSGSYADLTNKPTIPTVYNATLTIQKNGTTVKTFTANASSNVTCNITVPTTAADVSAEPAIRLTASRALVSNSSGKVAVSSVTNTELGYVSGVTSAIQTQLNTKQDTLVSGTSIKTINSNSLLGSGDITIASGANPVGTIIIWTTATAPVGYLICDGSAVSRTTYSDLFSVIGTTYGVGNGSSTFNLPNFTNRFIEGGTVGTYKAAGLPDITGTIAANGILWGRATGFFNGNAGSGQAGQNGLAANAGAVGTLTVKASYSNSIYGSSTTVQPPALCVKMIIKY